MVGGSLVLGTGPSWGEGQRGRGIGYPLSLANS